MVRPSQYVTRTRFTKKQTRKLDFSLFIVATRSLADCNAVHERSINNKNMAVGS